MARLIVEEGGKARRFKLNPGTLTIGSGESATLTLESSELAEVHAELEFDEWALSSFQSPTKASWPWPATRP